MKFADDWFISLLFSIFDEQRMKMKNYQARRKHEEKMNEIKRKSWCVQLLSPSSISYSNIDMIDSRADSRNTSRNIDYSVAQVVWLHQPLLLYPVGLWSTVRPCNPKHRYWNGLVNNVSWFLMLKWLALRETLLSVVGMRLYKTNCTFNIVLCNNNANGIFWCRVPHTISLHSLWV